MGRRLGIAVVALIVGGTLHLVGLPRWLAIGVGLGILVGADRLGLMPSPYEPSVHDLLHREGNRDSAGSRDHDD